MAGNSLTISGSFNATVDTTNTVAGQTYAGSASDQVVGSASGSISDDYNESVTCTIDAVIESTTNVRLPDSYKAGYTTIGTEPVAADLMRLFYIKVSDVLGNSANTVIVSLGGPASYTGLAELSKGEGICLPLSCKYEHIRIEAKYHTVDTDEITVTISLAKEV